MKTHLKKIAASLMAVATITSGAMGISASAANTEDTSYSFGIDIDQWSGAKYTDGRDKFDHSSVYVKLNTTGKSVRTQTQGTYSNGLYWTNHTSRGTVTITAGSWEVYNNIYESLVESGRYSNAYARLKMWAANSSSTGNVNGLWSPDCAGHYAVAN